MKIITHIMHHMREKPSWLSLGLISLGLVTHGLLLASFSDNYVTALSQSIFGFFSIFIRFGTLIKETYLWCFKYTGWFFFPLLACIIFSARILLIFLVAKWTCSPLPKVECLRKYHQASYVGLSKQGYSVLPARLYMQLRVSTSWLEQ